MQSRNLSGALVLGGIVAVAAGVLSGCTTPTPGASTSTTSASAAPIPDAVTPSAEDSAAPASNEPALDTEPTPDVSSEARTIEIATNAVTAFCRPTLDYQTWINELYPYLSQQAAVAYETVDPANVPCTALTGDAQVRDGDEAFTMRILVPTDAGEYSVYVHRPSETAAWAVEQITPLASE